MSEMKLIMENWRSSLDEILGFGGQKEPAEVGPEMKTMKDIQTVGQLRALIQTAQLKKRGEQLKGGVLDAAKSAIVDEIVGKVPGLAAAKSMFDLAKSAYALPDDATQGTALKYLNVDDDVSAIIDDELENAFLQDFMDTIESKPDGETIKSSVTQELQKWIASKHSQTTVKK